MPKSAAAKYFLLQHSLFDIRYSLLAQHSLIGQLGPAAYFVTCLPILTKVAENERVFRPNSKHRIYLPCSPQKRGLQFRGDFRRAR